MSVARYKTFSDGQVLSAADLNGIQDIVVTNGQDVGTPRTASFDMDGQRLILSADGNTSEISSTAGKIDFRLASADLVDLDGTVASPVNGLSVVASATGSAVQVKAKGSDTNIGVVVASKGTGSAVLRSNAVDVVTADGATASSVNALTVSSAATGNPTLLKATGGDTNIGLTLLPKGTGSILLDADPTGTGVDIDGAPLVLDADADSSLRETSDDVIAMKLQGMDAFIFDGDAASPVNGLTLRSSATTVDPAIAGHGTDSIVNVRLTPKSTGVAACAGGWAVDGATNLTWRWQGSGTSLLLQENTGTATSPSWTTRTTVTTGSTIAGPTLVSTHSPSGTANLDITLSGFHRFVIQLTGFPATDSVSLLARTKGLLSGGVFDSSASDYGYQYLEITSTGTVTGAGSTAAAQIELSGSNVGNNTLECISIRIEVDLDSTFSKRLTWAGGYLDTSTLHRTVQGSGVRLGNADTLTAIRLFWEGGGNWAAGSTARVWGMP